MLLPTVWTIPFAFGRHHYTDAFEMEPFDTAVVAVTSYHLRYLVIRTSTVTIDLARSLPSRRANGRRHRVDLRLTYNILRLGFTAVTAALRGTFGLCGGCRRGD